ncbi:HsdR family type I site-specific deoxyribonuclease [Iodobacter sp. CM08]|uniref:type I restriction endonuclease subunit R n=1 Tax=Iodobacter sp. CM08 TaxID=3085902 RepID=UPI00298158F3|nr:HsdR family type I site-specific deoxyribonuclease [Iodobacter sp. CM08]MDW5416882.1 HsdR family type I site-specific deoxyribonuclease [Iodobacter sp. CM08]
MASNSSFITHHSTFVSEAAFETALVNELKNKGWEDQVLKNTTEADLLQNWADILFQNNRDIDRLNDVPLTNSEMQQIVEQIRELKTPLKLNGFINGKTVSITRDNPQDPLHFGKEISLKIYDRHEIAAGQSRYQIVQQPQFAKASKILNDRRGDVLLLINGMPLIHIELKRSAVPVSHAYNQIEKYSAEGVFTGVFGLVQVFVAMTPSEMVYFANPGMDGKFNKDFYFHWADFNNQPMNDWKSIASVFLSIPMAHQLIGFYTVADHSDGVLKVMRSYQYFAANAISDKVSKTNWADRDRLGGHVWHTTGSGKTMTSFKSAQLIAHSKDADKVIFLMDRIELGVQSLQEYKGFAGEGESVQATENTGVLITKLKSTDPANTLIVSSIQKMSNINAEANDDGVSLQSHDIALINLQRIVFIVDEAHRSTFGDMLITIKATFPAAIFFGFTGTPIQDENQKNLNTTATVFGDELHRYTIADGIRDKNVLGFDPYKVMTYRDKDLRRAVALEKAKASTESEALADPQKKAVFNRYMRDVAMAGHKEANGDYVKGIEDELPNSQYEEAIHQQEVIKDIVDNWTSLSQNSKFHAIFATSSIKEAIEYYRRLKIAKPELKISALFDPNIDEVGNYVDTAFKQAGLIEIIQDYNAQYGQDFNLGSHAQFKKDLAARLAHKRPYLRLEKNPAQQIDLLIVVDQMLTGFDSKWLNTLYLDKMLKHENIIQAFSRTNRLYIEHEKPFGTIRYYRKPHTMERNIAAAIKMYSGDKPIGLFVEKLPSNLEKMNLFYADIAELFSNAGIANFEKLPADKSLCGQFAKLFAQLNQHLEAAKIQGFTWRKLSYPFGVGKAQFEITLGFDENTYLALALRYKELSSGSGDGGGGESAVPFDLSGHLTEIDTGKIDADYMNSRFEKYLKTIQQNDGGAVDIQKIKDELHKSFATLTQEEQKYANIFLNDVQRGDATLAEGKTFRDYITEYLANAKNAQITELVNALGKATDIAVFTDKLSRMMNTGITAANINEFGRLDTLKSYVDKAKAKAYFEKSEAASFSAFQINMKIDKLLQDFIMKGGLDLQQPNTCTA